MIIRKIVPGAALLLALSAGTALAQSDPSEQNFYSDPILPDPPLKPQHVFPASLATADVAAVSPAAEVGKTEAAKPMRTARNARPATGPCSVLNPCAVNAPAAPVPHN